MLPSSDCYISPITASSLPPFAITSILRCKHVLFLIFQNRRCSRHANSRFNPMQSSSGVAAQMPLHMRASRCKMRSVPGTWNRAEILQTTSRAAKPPRTPVHCEASTQWQTSSRVSSVGKSLHRLQLLVMMVRTLHCIRDREPSDLRCGTTRDPWCDATVS